MKENSIVITKITQNNIDAGSRGTIVFFYENTNYVEVEFEDNTLETYHIGDITVIN